MMMKSLNNFMRVFTLMLVATLLAGCSQEMPDIKILFVEQEPGVEPYQTRLIVTSNYMRFDDGEGSRDFVLFDRNKKLIYSTNSDEETVMSVAVKKVDHVKAPFELKQAVKNLGTLKDAPTIQGKAPLHYQFFTNDTHCYDVVAVKNLMPEVVKAMQEFHAILQTDSKLTLQTLPADMQDACNLSMSTFHVAQHLEYGFPIQEWKPDGTGRTLIDFDEKFKADAKLFELPKSYQVYSVQDYREGKVKFNH